MFRTTRGIVSDLDISDPRKEADVIMTAAALGFAASYIQKSDPIQFDMDPLEGQDRILDDGHIAEDHKTSRDAVHAYLDGNKGNRTVAGTIILDALTVHDGEADRINRTLKSKSLDTGA